MYGDSKLLSGHNEQKAKEPSDAENLVMLDFKQLVDVEDNTDVEHAKKSDTFEKLEKPVDDEFTKSTISAAAFEKHSVDDDHDVLNLEKLSHKKRDMWTDPENPDYTPDLIDESDSDEDDETDHFNVFKGKYGHGLPRHPDGSPSSPFLANAVIESHLRQLAENSEDENEAEVSMYVDDVLAVVENINQEIKMAATIFFSSNQLFFNNLHLLTKS